MTYIKKLTGVQKSSQLLYSCLVGFLGVLGTFNRITFPAFVAIPLLRLLPHFRIKYADPCPTSTMTRSDMLIDFNFRPWCLAAMMASALFNLAFAITLDSEWYATGKLTFTDLFSNPVITPLNNLLYNFDPNNLADHGLHPFYQHALINLPQLIGPAFLFLFTHPRPTNLLYSGLSAVFVLSCFKHQEARFLIPAVPLFLSSINLPVKWTRPFWVIWIIFNAIFGVLMGVYHQGGVVPAQLHISVNTNTTAHAFWWKTHSPPVYLVGEAGHGMEVHDLMGRPGDDMVSYVSEKVACNASGASDDSILVAPLSATYLDGLLDRKYLDRDGLPFVLTKLWDYRKHLNLDDLDFGEDGVYDTLRRVVGRRGIGIWKINRQC